jgi:hypothetical protein
MTGNIKNSFVKLQTYTWTKDSHALFDYESRAHHKADFDIEESTKIYRKDNELYIV